MSTDEFRAAGHRLVDELAEFLESLPQRKVTPGETVAEVRAALPPGGLPQTGRSGAELIAELTPLLIEHSLHNGHPRFFGYITSSAAPLGALADLLASTINANCGLRHISPAANEIEIQAVRWLAELIGFPTPCGGLMVSGGNMANILGFLAARRAKLPGNVREDGVLRDAGRPRVYASRETHTWIEKAADVSGIGTGSIRWIGTDSSQRIRLDLLEAEIARDRAAGDLPFLIVGTAGNVSTGATDALDEIAAIAADHELWFHVDGAYGAPAACLPESPASLRAISQADSVALDPHKWLYVPIEAGCTLVRDPDALRDAFSFHVSYYKHGDDADAGGIDYFEHGLQNSRGFRALKVWLCMREAGRDGCAARIRQNIALAHRLWETAVAAPEIEAGPHNLSITTFRYRPPDSDTTPEWQVYLDELNRALLLELQRSGDVYVSNASLGGAMFLRACIVNFRTQAADVDLLVETVLRVGRALDRDMRPDGLSRPV